MDIENVEEMVEVNKEKKINSSNKSYKIVFGYQPNVYTQAIRIISTEPNPPERTLEEILNLLNKSFSAEELYYRVSDSEEPKRFDDEEFNHIC